MTGPIQEHTPDPQPETPRNAWWKKGYVGCANWLKGTTTRWNVVVGFAFVGFGFLLVINQLDNLNERALRESEERILNDLHQIDLASYVRAVNDYTVCVESVRLGDANRGQWNLAVETIRETGGDMFADRLARGPLLSSEPRTLESCPLPGDSPTPPD